MTLKPTFEHYYPENVKGGQCGVFAHKLVEFPLVGDTISSKKAAVKKSGTLGKNCQIGDVLVLDVGTAAGHIAIINDDLGSKWQLTESNWKGDERVHHIRTIAKTSTQIYGFFRGKLKVAIYNPMITHNIVILLSHIEDIPVVQSAIAKVQARVAALGDIRISTGFQITDYAFHTKDDIGATGQPLVYADPAEIGAEGHKAELALSMEADAVCLIYDPAFVIGNKPTNPVENPQTYQGFNMFSIPENWYKNSETGEIYADSLEQFFYHEMLHSWFYLCNRENPTIGIPDTVHTYGGVTGPGHPTFEDILADFDSKALSLKPYWPALAVGHLQGTDMSNAKFVHKAGTQEYGFYLPATSPETIKDKALNLGREDLIKADGSVDFSKAKEVSGL